jgi:hypothetical protein
MLVGVSGTWGTLLLDLLLGSCGRDSMTCQRYPNGPTTISAVEQRGFRPHLPLDSVPGRRISRRRGEHGHCCNPQGAAALIRRKQSTPRHLLKAIDAARGLGPFPSTWLRAVVRSPALHHARNVNKPL